MKTKNIDLIIFIIILIFNLYVSLRLFDNNQIIWFCVHGETLAIITFGFLLYYWKPGSKPTHVCYKHTNRYCKHNCKNICKEPY